MTVSAATRSTPTQSTSAAKPAAQKTTPKSEKYGSSASLDEARQGSAVIKQNDGGPSVKELQKQLNAAGVQPQLELDGKFGPATDTAMRQFQQAQGLRDDGKAGANTMQALDRGATIEPLDAVRKRHASGSTVGNTAGSNAPTQAQQTSRPDGTIKAGDLQNTTQAHPKQPVEGSQFAPEPGRAAAPFAADRGAREQQAEALLKTNGQWPPKEGHVYAVQIDQDSPGKGSKWADRNSHLRNYTGQTAVFKAVDGKLVEQGGPFKSASHPGQMSTKSKFTDVNGDGNADIAHLRAGVYEYKAGSNHKGRYNPVSDRAMKVGRDINHDGIISGGKENANYNATALQIHAGGNGGPSSVGCQTMPPDDYRLFQSALKSGGDKTFTYVLARRPNDTHGTNPH